MRLIKAQTTNSRSIKGKGVKYTINNEVVLDSNSSLTFPSGTTAERPQDPKIGDTRFNTDTQRLETFTVLGWDNLAQESPSVGVGITQQQLGTGDAVETVFGPLDSGDPNFPVPVAAENIIVLTENVFQIANVNYTLAESQSGSLSGPGEPYADGTYIVFSSPPDVDIPITVLHNFDK